MAIPQHTDSLPAYIVYRDIPPGEPFDPTSPLLFFPEKGSDELFDALRISFPHVKSHQERMREAVIRYLLEERQDEQSQQQTSPAMTMDSMPTTWPSVSASPDTMNFDTPASFANSPQLHGAQLTRQASTATSSQPSPPSLDQMTGVFSLSTSSQPKQRVRRKMTEAEKVEYRKRRIVKACDKCAKRKRKCPHNQAEMEVLTSTSSKTSSRVSKSVSPRSGQSNTSPAPATASSQEVVLDPYLFSTDDTNLVQDFDLSAFAPLEDFDMFQDPFPELTTFDQNLFDQFQPTTHYKPRDFFTPDISPTQQDWSYGDIEDFTLLDPILPDHFDISETRPQARAAFASRDGSSSGSTGGLGRQQPFQPDSPDIATALNRYIDSSASTSHFRQGGRLEECQKIGRGVTVDNEGMLWEHLRTGQPEKPVPTHTAHVHDSECGGQSGLDNSIGRPQEPTVAPTPASPQTILRPTGTKKAIETFAGLSSRRAPSDQSVSLRTTDAVRSGELQSHLTQPTDGVLRPSQNMRSTTTAERHNILGDTSELYDVNNRESRIPDTASKPRHGSGIEPSPRNTQHTHTWESGVPGVSQEQELAFTSVPASRGSRATALQGRPSTSAERRVATQQAVRTPHNGRYNGQPEPSLGEGIPEYADPASQLYMARKRVASGLTLLVGRNMNAHLPAGPSTSMLAENHTNRLPSAANGTQQSSPSPSDVAKDGKNAHALLQKAETSPSMLLAAKPTHTRPRKPTASSSSGDVDRQASSATAPRDQLAVIPEAVPGTVASPAGHQERLSDHVRYRDHHGRPTLQESRLRDYCYVRDHNGRSTTPTTLQAKVATQNKTTLLWSAILGSIACFLLAASSSLAPSALLLAMLYISPQQSSSSKEEESIVQCTIKNSAWLSSSTSGEERGKLASRQAFSTWGSDGGVVSWLRGLMYPYAFAPLRFAS